MTTEEQVTTFYRNLIVREFPVLEGKVKVVYGRRSRHIYEARAAGRGFPPLQVVLVVSFLPTKKQNRWAEHLAHAAEACYEIYSGKTHAVAVRQNGSLRVRYN